jgi:hypothetical protein
MLLAAGSAGAANRTALNVASWLPQYQQNVSISAERIAGEYVSPKEAQLLGESATYRSTYEQLTKNLTYSAVSWLPFGIGERVQREAAGVLAGESITKAEAKASEYIQYSSIYGMGYTNIAYDPMERYNLAKSAAIGGTAYLESSHKLLAPKWRSLHNFPDILAGISNEEKYGLQPGYANVSRGMQEGNLSEINAASLNAMISNGDFQGIESLRALGVPPSQLDSGKAEAFKIQAIRTSAMAGEFLTGGYQSALVGSLAGGKLPSQLNLSAVKFAASELSENLRKISEEIKSVSGEGSTQYAKAFQDFQVAAKNAKEITASFAAQIVAESGLRAGIVSSKIGYQEQAGILSMGGTTADLANIGFTGRSELQGSISMIQKQLPNLSGMDRLNAEAAINKLKTQQLLLPYQSVQLAFQKEDFLNYGMKQMEISNISARANSLPYAPGYRFGISMAQISLNDERIEQLESRREYMKSKGILSPEQNLALNSQIESLTTSSWQQKAILSEGVANRMPALSAGSPSFYGRFTSDTLAAFNVLKVGSPIRAYGAVNSEQQRLQDSFYGSFPSARSRTEEFNNGDVLGTLKSIEKLLQQSLGASPAFHPAAGLNSSPPANGYRKTGASLPIN